jgi:hypothetical protein
MLWKLRTCLCCALALTPHLAGSDLSAKITVLTYNDARVTESDLRAAKRKAARIYARAEIDTDFIDCPTTPSEASRFPDCNVPLTPSTLAVHIYSSAMADRLKLDPTAIGTALFGEDGSLGRVAIVCPERSARLGVNLGSRSNTVVLGTLIAHELGHLLLGPGSHSRSGIMHTPWTRQEIGTLEAGAMQFSDAEAKHLRNEVCRRILNSPPDTFPDSRPAKAHGVRDMPVAAVDLGQAAAQSEPPAEVSARSTDDKQ